MKMLFSIITLSILTSCTMLGVVQDAAAGNTTAYLGKYTVPTDSLFYSINEDQAPDLYTSGLSDVKQKANEALKQMGFYLYTENGNTSQWEYQTSAIDRRATGKFGKSTWSMTNQTDSSRLLINLRVYGNYKYGTKEKADAIVDTFKRKLFDVVLESKKKKSKKN